MKNWQVLQRTTYVLTLYSALLIDFHHELSVFLVTSFSSFILQRVKISGAYYFCPIIILSFYTELLMLLSLFFTRIKFETLFFVNKSYKNLSMNVSLFCEEKPFYSKFVSVSNKNVNLVPVFRYSCDIATH